MKSNYAYKKVYTTFLTAGKLYFAISMIPLSFRKLKSFCELESIYHHGDNGKTPCGFHYEKLQEDRRKGRDASDTKILNICNRWKLCRLKNRYRIDDNGKIIFSYIHDLAIILGN